MEPIQAFRNAVIPIVYGDQTLHAAVPLNLETITRMEQTAEQTEGTWWKLKKGKFAKDVFDAFCKPYLPPEVDLMKVQPTFSALFFSQFRAEYQRSISECMTLLASTRL